MPRKRKMFALVSNQGTAMPETLLTEEEYNDPVIRARTEREATLIADFSGHVEWHDVTDAEWYL